MQFNKNVFITLNGFKIAFLECIYRDKTIKAFTKQWKSYNIAICYFFCVWAKCKFNFKIGITY